MIMEGNNAVEKINKLIGPFHVEEAKSVEGISFFKSAINLNKVVSEGDMDVWDQSTLCSSLTLRGLESVKSCSGLQHWD